MGSKEGEQQTCSCRPSMTMATSQSKNMTASAPTVTFFSHFPSFIFILSVLPQGCSNCGYCLPFTENTSVCKDKYDSTQSNDYEEDGSEFAIQYGSGSVTGMFSKDTVTIAQDIAVKHQKFAEVQDAAGMGVAYVMGKVRLFR